MTSTLNTFGYESALQTKIDALTVSSSMNEILLLANAAGANTNKQITVETTNDLPAVYSGTYGVDVGTIIFVNSIGIPLVACETGWYGLDGRCYSGVRNDLWAWGYNLYGQLGDNNGTVTSRSSPVSVVGGFTWKQVSAGVLHTAAIKSDDTLWTWGYNLYGNLGDNTTTNRSSPVSVVGGFTWKQVSAGYHTAAIKSDDTLWAWGRNNYGQLGDNNGTVTSRSSPVSVVGGFTWKQVSAGWYHTAAIKSDDTLWAWGVNDFGQLGDNNDTVTTRSSPVSVVGGFTWKQVSAGWYHTAAIKSDGSAWVWGRNNYGQLGDNNGTVTSRSSPVSVVGGFTWKQMSAGGNHTAAIKSDDTLWTWGYNYYGQLGDNNDTVTTRSSPVLVVGGFTWKQVSAGGNHTAAIKSDDTLWTWGRNVYGQLGDNTAVNKSSPVSVVGGFTWKSVSAGDNHTTAIKSDGSAWVWGSNSYGQLGDNNGTVSSRSSPVSVVGGFTWKQVGCGAYHTAAIKSDDTLWTWGWNTYGQLGDNTLSNRSSPVSVVGGFIWKQVSAGWYHTAAIRSDDTIWTWGINNFGQLGTNNTSSRSSPVSVVGGFIWKQVSAGIYHTTAIKSDDTLWTWGYNTHGQLGDNSTTTRSSPVSVVGGFTWKQVSAGVFHTTTIRIKST